MEPIPGPSDWNAKAAAEAPAAERVGGPAHNPDQGESGRRLNAMIGEAVDRERGA